jgi:light-regulated signal transduction histidine kinase (bacteriophytochrome)
MVVEAPSGKIITANTRVREILRQPLPAAGDVVPYARWKGYRPDGRALGAEEWPPARALGRGEAVRDEELQYEFPDGTRGWLSISSAPLSDARGKVFAAIVTVADVTRHRQAEEALRQTNAELEAFSYTVSHDLRAPFRHVVGFAQLLRREADRLSDAGRRNLDNIINAAASAGRLIDNLLAFARLGRAALSPAPVDVYRLVESVRREVMQSEGQGRAITWNVADVPAARADAAMLQVVVRNLLSNAVKYTRPTAQAVIDVGSAPGSGGQVVYFVRDNGVGFDMKYADKLFGVFQRLHRQEDFPGTGIGLASVKRIVERHGGRAWAESEPGRGATFYVSHPPAE